MKPRINLTPEQRNGRSFLFVALLIVGSILLADTWSELRSKRDARFDQLINLGFFALLLLFAYRGGPFSLFVFKILSVLWASITTIGIVALAIAGSYTSIPRALTPLLAAWFLVWTFFRSQSVQAFVKRQQFATSLNHIKLTPAAADSLKNQPDPHP